jgi:hypothetical protein
MVSWGGRICGSAALPPIRCNSGRNRRRALASGPYSSFNAVESRIRHQSIKTITGACHSPPFVAASQSHVLHFLMQPLHIPHLMVVHLISDVTHNRMLNSSTSMYRSLFISPLLEWKLYGLPAISCSIVPKSVMPPLAASSR